MGKKKRPKDHPKGVHYQGYPQPSKDKDSSGNVVVTPKSLRQLADVCHEAAERKRLYQERKKQRGPKKPYTGTRTPRRKATLPEAFRAPEPHIIEPQEEPPETVYTGDNRWLSPRTAEPETDDHIIGHRWDSPTAPPKPIFSEEEKLPTEDSRVEIPYNPENNVKNLVMRYAFNFGGTQVPPNPREIIIVYSQKSLVEKIHSEEFEHYDTGEISVEEQRFLKMVNTALEAEDDQVLFNNEFLFLKDNGKFSIRDRYRIVRGNTESLSDFLIDSVGELIFDLKHGFGMVTDNISTISGIVIPGFRETYPVAMKDLENTSNLRRIIIAEEAIQNVVLRSEIANEPYKAEIFLDS